jgi:hypothetical protein
MVLVERGCGPGNQIMDLLIIGFTCIASTSLGIYLGIKVSTGLASWKKVARKRK